MKKAGLLGASFAVALAGIVSGAEAAECRGVPFDGYIAAQYPAMAVPTPGLLNTLFNEDVVRSVEPASGDMLLIQPADPTISCERFIDRLEDTGLFRYIAPNTLIKIDPVFQP